MPEGKEKDDVSEKITAASRSLQLAEASMAKDLSYELCKCSFPPQIMLFTGKKQYEYQCPRCQFIVNNSATSVTFSK